MGSGQSIHPDQSKRSRDARLPPSHYHKLVIFGENTVNQVAFLLDPLPSCRSPQETNFRVKITYDVANGDPVIGLAAQGVDPDGVNFQDDQSLFVWYISRGTVNYKGQLHQLDQPMPRVESEAEVLLQYVPTTRRLTITVTNPGKDSLSEGITLTELPSQQFLPEQFLPFVGAEDTGNSPTQFLLLESSITDHTNNALIDMTLKVLFTTSFGVVNISRDCKAVTRTSTQQGNGCALLPVKLATGVHRWGFVVQCDFGASLCLGLARYPFRLSEDYLKDHVKHIYRHPGLLVYRSYRGLLYQDGKQLSESLDPLGWQHGKKVLIEFIFDSSTGTLEVVRNDRSLGIAFRGLTGIFQPVVCFYAAYEKDVRLKHYLTSESSVEMTTVQSPPSSLENTAQMTGKVDVTVESESVRFEESRVVGSIHVTADGKTLYRDKNQSGNCLCLLNQKCSDVGTYRISFIIEYDHGASACLGITRAGMPDEIKISGVGNVYSSTSLYLYRSFQGMLYVEGKEQSKRLEEFWMSGTLVEMEIEVGSDGYCSVSFKVNAVDQGVAFSGLRPPLTPLVAFYAGMEKRVTVLHYEYVSEKEIPKTSLAPSALPLPTLKTDSGLNDIDTVQTQAPPSELPLICSYKDAAVFYETCMRCENDNDIIALPCKHSTVCSKDLNLGVNAPTRHCMVCDGKITQVWNILLGKKPS